MPISTARSRIACDSSSVALGPKCIVPRQMRLTLIAERPSFAYSIRFPPRRGSASPQTFEDSLERSFTAGKGQKAQYGLRKPVTWECLTGHQKEVDHQTYEVCV